MYATYDFYVTEFYGDILTDENFDKCASRASDYIDYLTMGKAKSYTDTDNVLARCCCALAEQYPSLDALTVSVADGEVASETVGSHSVSYRSSAEVKASWQANLLSIAQMYLTPTGLLYRGVPCIRRIP